MKTVGLVAILLGCACGSSAPVSTPKAVALGKADIEQIVNASMNEFFVRKDWRDWSEGDFVLLEPKWADNGGALGSEKSNSAFEKFLESSLEETKLPAGQANNLSPDEKKTVEAQAAALNRIQKEYKQGAGLTSPSIPDLKDLNLDPRIVLQRIDEVKSLRNSGIWFDGRSSITSKAGKKGTLRVYGRLGQPLFSPNGKFAILVMSWVPWSMHSAVLQFFLERKDSDWKVIYVGEIYFV